MNTLARGALLIIAICCGLLVIGAIQSTSRPGEVGGDFALAVLVAFVGIVCAWLAFRKAKPK